MDEALPSVESSSVVIAEGISLRCGHHLLVAMANMDLGDDGCASWCERALTPAVLQSLDSVKHAEIDMSGNQLTDKGLTSLLNALRVERHGQDPGCSCNQHSKLGNRSCGKPNRWFVPLVVLRLHNNLISAAGLGHLGDFLSDSAMPLRELHLSHNPVSKSDGFFNLLDKLAATSLYPLNHHKRQVPLFIRLECCGLPDPAQLVENLALQGLSICVIGTTAAGCSRSRCAMEYSQVPAFHLHGLFNQGCKNVVQDSPTFPEDLELRYTVALLTSGKCARIFNSTLDRQLNEQVRSEHNSAHGCIVGGASDDHHNQKRLLPALPREVTINIFSFILERFIKLHGKWGFTCAICNTDYSFRKYPRVSMHTTAQRHQRRLQALEAGRLMSVHQTGLEISRFRDGLGLSGQFCPPQAVQDARALVPISEAGVDLKALRAAGVRGLWASPQDVKRAGRIAAARGVSAEGARHRRDNKGRARWALYAPPPGSEWSEELAHDLMELDAFFDGVG